MSKVSHIPSLVAKMNATFLSQKTKPLAFRRGQLKQLLKGMKEMNDDFGAAIKSDLGYNEFTHFMINQSITEMAIQEVIDNLSEWTSTRYVDTSILIGPGTSYTKPEPLGLSLIVGAWNYPLFTIIPQLAFTIAAGNCAVLKPSEMSEQTSKMVKKLVDKYLDNSCYKVEEGSIETIVALLDQKWDLIQFTGSPMKGKLVAQAAAKNLTRTVLELGGKSPLIVDKDCNMDSTLKRLVQSKYANSGQTCVAPDFVMCHSSIYDNFMKLLVEQVKHQHYQKDGSAQDGQPNIINHFHTERLQGMLKETKGKIMVGGNVDIDNKKVDYTVVDRPDVNDTIMQEEIFGPILPVLKYDDINEVIEFINQREKPLALYYFGSKNKEIVRDSTSSGAFVQNDATMQVLDFEIPFGGVGNSGSGCVNTRAAFDGCSHLKAVLEKGNINCFPFHCRFPPYTQSKIKIWKTLVNVIGIKRQNQNIKRSLFVLFLGALIAAAFIMNAKYAFKFNFEMVRK